MDVTPQEIVGRAADLLAEFGWCRNTYAINDRGDQVPSRSPDAVAFCAIGALQRAALEFGVCTWQKEPDNPFLLACELVSQTIGEPTLTHWNDCKALPGQVQMTFETVAGLSDTVPEEAKV